jgi:hypothetical protein
MSERLMNSVPPCAHLRQDGEQVEQARQRRRAGLAAEALH